ncbi:DUF3541 domain-containing protein [Gallaecimonas xiamenensis]|uniref:DUF3541 domain-containing protein n=1 Tax=Gallaecimonas xiamenensis 3-C-1 TaxID=745411 RepID=K2JVM0_9GAMM|nr:DUF3541 domain-containing protein [Gallaecimonas xiamenensis]EKE69230.1 hypothetical protein B3C1_15547 [Gallaecimonas xiamenensis 3-C-1]
MTKPPFALCSLLLALALPALGAPQSQVPTAEEASLGIQQQLEHHLYQLPPRVQGHYGIRLWRLTGDRQYLNSALYDLYVVSDRLEAISRGLTQPGFVADYSRRLVEGQPNTERGRLREASVKGREKYLFYADELLRYMSRLDELGFRHPSDPYFRNILKSYDFKPAVTDPVMIKAWAAQLANHVWWLHQLGIVDLRQDFVKAFKATYPNDKDGELSDQQFENKVYGMTHIVFADSEYYQRHLDPKEYRWITDYLTRHMDEILERTKPDVYAEVGIVFELLGLKDSPTLAQAKGAVLAAIDPEHKVVLSEQGNPDLALGEHRNVLAWMLLNWPDKLHKGPLLGRFKALRDDLPLSVVALPKKKDK